jgi:hypothetical protein
VTPDREELSTQPVHLGRRRDRHELDEQDELDGYVVQHEVLDEQPRPLWRPPRWLVTAVVLVFLVATAGWYLDRQDRSREAQALEGCRRQLHNAVVFADLRLMAMANYLSPALSQVSAGRRGQLTEDMSVVARTVLSDVERADRACRAVSIRPWHFGLASQHRATTAYSGALAARVRGVADRGRTYYHDNTAIQRLRDAAGIGVIGGPF